MDASLLLATYLATQGVEYTLVDSTFSCACDHDNLNAALAVGVEMAVVLAATARSCARRARSVRLGCLSWASTSGLGLLANRSDAGVVAIVAAALAGDVVAEQRANLRIDVVCEGEPDPWSDDDDGEGPSYEAASPCEAGARSFFALNELAVTRGANGRVIDFTLGVSGSHVAEMRGDGLVVATATGSTAYALSAGGPLVAPGFTGLVVVPLAPPTLHSRAIVTASNDVVEMGLPRDAARRDATLFADGELLSFDRPVRRIYVSRGEAPTVLLRHQHEGFYEHAAKVFF